jgi:hypothetical protein
MVVSLTFVCRNHPYTSEITDLFPKVHLNCLDGSSFRERQYQQLWRVVSIEIIHSTTNQRAITPSPVFIHTRPGLRAGRDRQCNTTSLLSTAVYE